MPVLEITPIPLLQDNYAWLLRDANTGATAVVVPSEARPVADLLSSRHWALDFVLNTHHHHDHTGGNSDLGYRRSSP